MVTKLETIIDEDINNGKFGFSDLGEFGPIADGLEEFPYYADIDKDIAELEELSKKLETTMADLEKEMGIEKKMSGK